ncbi:hypothetical protein PpBr36_03822 [Pyricularia pennisetigena]|uniref:hypothetical protein n=1 Tax=Pyricularia pennisetigena TaxID=1578925 RepID=UPI001152DC95|nr:hypothetical protein PpBr36_03822 [Pyricularia pennisetigena]TLS30325.1 hypothetical protein PpBr36_03822 [Pyricularia pennisetigena]
MPGLEPIAALGLAFRTTTTAAVSNGQGAQAPAARDRQLLSLVDRCQGAARDLEEEVKFLQGIPGGKARLLAALQVAAKTTWRKRRLDNLDRKLKETEAHLQTGLLARIFERTEKTGIDLSALDEDVRSFVQEYRKGHTDTAKLVSTESIKTRNHVSVEVKQSEVAIRPHIAQHAMESERWLRQQIGAVLVENSQLNNDIRLQGQRDKLLSSLKFDRINERGNQIKTSHSGTCTWVLRDGSDESRSRVSSSTPSHDSSGGWEDGADNGSDLDHDSRSASSDTDSSYGESDHFSSPAGSDFEWDSLSDWLRSNKKVYWISGKPGAGKSTLIKYILRDTRTSDLLQLWCPNPVLVSHFFWRPGTEMHQSIKSKGFCLLSHDTPSLDRVLGTSTDMALKDSDTDWSAEELQLRLEKLNFADLGRYALINITIPSDYHADLAEGLELELHGKLFQRYNTPSRAEIKKWLVTVLTKKAEGVFLWLFLTTKTVTKAVLSGETIQDLVHRIDRLPGDLSQLYTDMWARNNADDTDHLKDRAAVYFRLALAGAAVQEFTLVPWVTPFTMAIATKPDLTGLCLETSRTKVGLAARLLRASVATKRDVEARCFGLLECSQFGGPHSPQCMMPWHGDEFKKLAPYVSPDTAQFHFVHRTARDFLIHTETGRALMGFTTEALHTKRALELFKGYMASCTLFLMMSKLGWAGWNSIRYAFSLSVALSRNDLEGETELKSEIRRMLVLCERLFDYGYLHGFLEETAPYAIPGLPQTYTTVRRQHSFFRFSVFLMTKYMSFEPLFELLVDIARARDLDKDTKSYILYCVLYRPCETYEQPGPIERLLEWGCSPSAKIPHQQFRGIEGEVLETPLRYFLESKCWTLTAMQDSDAIELKRRQMS